MSKLKYVNKVELVGTIEDRPELYGAGVDGRKQSMITFSVRTGALEWRGVKNKSSVAHTVKAWGPLAENVYAFATPGEWVRIEGRLLEDIWGDARWSYIAADECTQLLEQQEKKTTKEVDTTDDLSW